MTETSTTTQDPSTTNFAELSFDELESLYKRTANKGVCDEMASRCKMQLMQHRDFMRKVLNLYRHPRIAVVDLEATCYDKGEPQNLPNEVIEVGVAVLDTTTMQVVDRLQVYVKPTLSYVTPFCTSLTGITPETVADAPTYTQCCETIDDWAKNYKVPGSDVVTPLTAWVSYGEADPNYFDRQSSSEGVLRPWTHLEYLNIKQLAGVFFGFGKKKNPGLKKAMGLAGIEMQGQHHSGCDDAFNTALLLAHMLRAAPEQK